MRLRAFRQLGYCVWCWSIWSDFGTGSDCLSPPPRLVLTLVSESWRAPLVSSCVAREIHSQSRGQEGGHPVLPRCQGESSPTIDFFSLFPLRFLQMLLWRKLFFSLTNTKYIFSTSVCCRTGKNRKQTEENNQAGSTFFPFVTDKGSCARINII